MDEQPAIWIFAATLPPLWHFQRGAMKSIRSRPHEMFSVSHRRTGRWARGSLHWGRSRTKVMTPAVLSIATGGIPLTQEERRA